MPTLGVIFPPDLPPEDLHDVACMADEAGLEELWLWEDCFAESGLASAAAVLGWTQRLRVGIGLFPVPLRNVALTAMELATLARVFPDRVTPGVGHGVLDWMGQVGVRAQSPMTLLAEYTTALRQLLAGESVSVKGRYVTLQDVALAWPPTTPLPILVGAMGPRTLRLACELADGVILSERTTMDGVRDALTEVAEHAQEGFSVVTFVNVRDDLEPGEVAELAQRYFDAGATTVALHSIGEGRPPLADFARTVADEVAPLLR
jgi:alkanesulfonate monooxygenase SsuD/methylene tetrahydromethanopterin reductase-like flavin-dependent oxidoreductase (luciferase family)